MHGGKEVLGKKCLRRKQQGARWKRGIREKVFETRCREKVFEKETTRCTVEKRH